MMKFLINRSIKFFRKFSIITKNELELKIKNKENYILIDVRTPKETDVCLIETAKKIPLSELEDALNLNNEQFNLKYNFVKPKSDDEIIFYCRSGARSTSASEISEKKGFKKYLFFFF
jgi:thiosulfate:glutathione sulfurtransferase